MDWLLWAVAGVLVLAVCVYALVRFPQQPAPRPVLPSHYDPWNYAADPATIAGWCGNCETMNDGEYYFCENCAAELPRGVHRTQSRNQHWFSKRE